MAIVDGTGEWETTSIDSKGHIYALLCSLGKTIPLYDYIIMHHNYKSNCKLVKKY